MVAPEPRGEVAGTETLGEQPPALGGLTGAHHGSLTGALTEAPHRNIAGCVVLNVVPSQSRPPFAELVDRYRRDVARLCAALAGPGDAEDAAQRAWLKALQAYGELRHTRNLRGWLLKIAANSAMDGHRDRSRRPAPVAAIGEDVGGVAYAPEPADDDLWRLVGDLPERQRVAVTLRYGLDLGHRQIADVLGATEAASRRLVSDGLATLRAELSTRE